MHTFWARGGVVLQEDSVCWGSVLSNYHVSLGGQTQVLRLRDTPLYLPSHVTSLLLNLWYYVITTKKKIVSHVCELYQNNLTESSW